MSGCLWATAHLVISLRDMRHVSAFRPRWYVRYGLCRRGGTMTGEPVTTLYDYQLAMLHAMCKSAPAADSNAASTVRQPTRYFRSNAPLRLARTALRIAAYSSVEPQMHSQARRKSASTTSRPERIPRSPAFPSSMCPAEGTYLRQPNQNRPATTNAYATEAELVASVDKWMSFYKYYSAALRDREPKPRQFRALALSGSRITSLSTIRGASGCDSRVLPGNSEVWRRQRVPASARA